MILFQGLNINLFILRLLDTSVHEDLWTENMLHLKIMICSASRWAESWELSKERPQYYNVLNRGTSQQEEDWCQSHNKLKASLKWVQSFSSSLSSLHPQHCSFLISTFISSLYLLESKRHFSHQQQLYAGTPAGHASLCIRKRSWERPEKDDLLPASLAWPRSERWARTSANHRTDEEPAN